MPPHASKNEPAFRSARARRVVGHDRGDPPVPEGLPQPFPVLGVSDRGRALVLGRAVGDLLGRERQVVRAGLDRDARAGARRVVETGRRREVEHVGPAPGRRARLGDGRDRRLLRLRRPGAQVRAVRERVGIAEPPRGALDRFGELGVHDQQPVERRDLGRRRPELLELERSELVDARRTQEALEPEHAGVVELAQVPEIVRHRPAPEPDVDVGLPLGGGPLLGERIDGGRRRDAVQRHVEDRRHAAGRGRARRGLEPLPLGASRLVHVHVGVDHARGGSRGRRPRRAAHPRARRRTARRARCGRPRRGCTPRGRRPASRRAGRGTGRRLRTRSHRGTGRNVYAHRREDGLPRSAVAGRRRRPRRPDRGGRVGGRGAGGRDDPVRRRPDHRGAREHPPPPVPMDDARAVRRVRPVRLARRALPGLGAARRGGRPGGGAGGARRARAHRVHDRGRPPLPGAPRRRHRVRRDRRRREDRGDPPAPRARLDGPRASRAAASRPTTSSRTSTRSSPRPNR